MNLRKQFLFGIWSLAFTASWGSSALAAGGVYGSWGQISGGFSANGHVCESTFSFKIEPDLLTAINRCVCDQGKITLTASASSKAQVTPTSIVVTEESFGQGGDPNIPCNVSQRPGQVNYELNGDSLKLSTGQEVYTFSRLAE